VFPDESFAQDVEDYASAFQKLSSSAIALTKQLLYQVDGLTFAAALHVGLDTNVIARMTEDCKKGIARFLQRE